jgi:heavy metal sensor kinase
LFAFPLVFLIAMSGGLFLARRSLAPLARITSSAKDISVSNLDKRLPLRNTGDELDELAQAFNDVFARLQTSYQKIVQFTADASHELRLPITTIRGEAEVVLERERSIDEYKRVLTSIIEEFDRLGKLINSLLILSRSDSGQGQSEFQRVNLAQLLTKVCEFFAVVAESKTVSLRLQTDVVLVKGDKTDLECLFSNLIDNAIKYTPVGGWVEVSTEQRDGFALVLVKDSGIGISPKDQQRIFDRFYRVDKSRSRALGGVVLGLSICKSIVEAHGGKIELHSQLGMGSTFIVWLPQEKSV